MQEREKERVDEKSVRFGHETIFAGNGAAIKRLPQLETTPVVFQRALQLICRRRRRPISAPPQRTQSDISAASRTDSSRNEKREQHGEGGGEGRDGRGGEGGGGG